MNRQAFRILQVSTFILLLHVSCKKSNSSNNSQPSGTTVSTLAGSGQHGSANGSGSSASFFQPTDVCLDQAGNIIVADHTNSLIRKVSPQGNVSLLAGNIADGQNCTDGIGDGADFTTPEGLFADKNGTIYVADGGCGIRQVGANGTVQTFFRSDINSAYTVFPAFNCVDDQGNVYLINNDNFTDPQIYKIDPQLNISIFAGTGVSGYHDGPAASAQFEALGGITIDNQNNIYVIDGSRIRKISQGNVSTVAGNGQSGYMDGLAANAEFGGIGGLCIDAKGNIFVTGYNDGRIREISAQGMVSTVAGSDQTGYKDGAASTAQFLYPRGICLDTGGNLIVADYGNNRIRKITLPK